MPHTPFNKLMLASALTLALAACGGDGADPAPAPVTPAPTPTPVPMLTPGDVVVLTASNKLLSFDRATPGTIRTTVAVTGLQAGENLIGIDYRPADRLLYGIGSSGRIYTLDSATGAATFKSTLSADPTDTTAPFTALAGTEFGVDFNPVADRLRIVGNTGQSLRINVDTGATTTDGNINGGAASTAINAAAYTNSFAGTASTTLFVIDAANSTLYTQNPPNNGTLASAVPLGVTATSVAGFDIDATNNVGYAVMTVAGARNLYTVNLAATSGGSAAATLVAAVAATEELRGLAVRTPAAPLVFGLTDDNRIVGFKPATPGTLDSNVAVGGLGTGEKLLGIDVRPKDGLMYAVTNTGRLITIDPLTGVTTFKAVLGADPADTSLPFGSLDGTAFAVDFNPVADRLRVIGNSGQNLRINVDTGAVTTDTVLNRPAGGATPLVTAAAYTNSFAGTTATTLYDIDTAAALAGGARLTQQTPPNDGVLVNVGALNASALGDIGMDIAGGANGLVLAALRASNGGPSTLYRIDLATGAAAPVSAIGNGQLGLIDIAIVLK